MRPSVGRKAAAAAAAAAVQEAVQAAAAAAAAAVARFTGKTCSSLARRLIRRIRESGVNVAPSNA